MKKCLSRLQFLFFVCLVISLLSISCYGCYDHVRDSDVDDDDNDGWDFGDAVDCGEPDYDWDVLNDYSYEDAAYELCRNSEQYYGCGDGAWQWPKGAECNYVIERNGKTWTVCDNGKWISFPCAACYAEIFRIVKFCGYDDWRLPTIDELAALYDPDVSYKIDSYITVHIEKPFKLWGDLVWSSAREDAESLVFDYCFGDSHPAWDKLEVAVALAVRP